MAAEPAGDETFWRWSIIVAGAVIVAGLSAILFVGKSSAQDSAASVTSTTLPSGLHVVVGTATPVPTVPTRTTTPAKIKIPTLTPIGKLLAPTTSTKGAKGLPTFVKLPFTFGTPGTTVTSPTKAPTSTTTTTTVPTTTPTTTTTTTTTTTIVVPPTTTTTTIVVPPTTTTTTQVTPPPTTTTTTQVSTTPST